MDLSFLKTNAQMRVFAKNFEGLWKSGLASLKNVHCFAQWGAYLYPNKASN